MRKFFLSLILNIFAYNYSRIMGISWELAWFRSMNELFQGRKSSTQKESRRAHGWMNAIHAYSILSRLLDSFFFFFIGSPKNSPPAKKKKRSKRRERNRKLSMRIYHMNERVLVPSPLRINLTFNLPLLPSCELKLGSKKGTKTRERETFHFP